MSRAFFREIPSSSRFSVIDTSRYYGYGDLLLLSDAIVEKLRSNNVASPIVVSLSNSVELIAVILACMRFGISCSLLPKGSLQSSVAEIESLLNPSCYLFSDPEPSAATGFGYECSFQIRETNRPIYGYTRPTNRPKLDREPVETSFFKLTSGSTGRSKMIRLPLRAMEEEAQNICDTLALTENDRIFVPVSMLHSYGFDLGVLAPLLAGSTVIVSPRFSPTLLQEVASCEATVFLGIPKMFELLIREQINKPDLKRLRWTLSCTAALSAGVLHEFYNRYRTVVTQHYGTSETGALTNHLPDEVFRRPESVGVPLQGVSIELIDENGNSTPYGPGFVFARSKAIAAGYLRNTSGVDLETIRHDGFMDGGYNTHDLATMDKQGYLYLISQKNRAPGKEHFIIPQC